MGDKLFQTLIDIIGFNLDGVFDLTNRQRKAIGLERETMPGQDDGYAPAVPANQLGRCSLSDNFAVIHDGHLIAQILRFLHVMGGQNDGFAFGLDALN